MPPSAKPHADVNDDVPPLAMYHICRICLRPRSARYHRENPIPLDGYPPPARDICRRCRVCSLDDYSSAIDVVEEGKNNNIRISVAGFVPDEDYVANPEARRRRARRVLSDNDRQEPELAHSSRSNTDPGVEGSVSDLLPTVRAQNEVVYRYVRRPASPRSMRLPETRIYIPPPPPASPNRVPAVGTATETCGAPFRTFTIPPPPPSEPEVVLTTRVGCAPARVLQIRASSRESSAANTSSVVDVKSQPPSAGVNELEIRRLAREEVLRYRQAERKLESHRDPFAHGRMVEVRRVPVKRRIVQEKDSAVEMPWLSSNAPPRQKYSLSTVKSKAVSSGRAAGALHVEADFPSTKATAGTVVEPVNRLPERIDELQQSYSRQEHDQGRSQVAQLTTSVSQKRHPTTRLDVQEYHNGKADSLDQASQGQGERGSTERPRFANQDDLPEREYEYTRRVIRPVSGPKPQSHESGTHYRETSEYLHRKGVSQMPRAARGDATNRITRIERRVSDTSSRVHFSKKIDISPTPPDSEASSSEFRSFAIKAEINESHDGGMHHIEERGRHQDRAQPGGRSAASDITVRPSAHILSESPSRERFRQMAKAQERKGYGPYVREERRSASVDVEDGSTVASVSWSGSGGYRHGGRRGGR